VVKTHNCMGVSRQSTPMIKTEQSESVARKETNRNGEKYIGRQKVKLIWNGTMINLERLEIET